MLGLEQDKYGVTRAVFRLVGNDGTMAISENGILDKDQVSLSNNLDKDHPLFIPFRIDEVVHYVEQAILSIYIDRYRAYERGAKSGGQTTSSSSSKTRVTSGSSSKSKSTSEYSDAKEITGISDYPIWKDTMTENGRDYVEVDENGKLYIDTYKTTSLKHQHKYVTKDEGHTHLVDINHTHDVNIDHTHEIDGHTYQLEYGIYEDSYPSNISVYINNNLVASGINSDTEVNVTNYLIPGYTNICRITSNTNGFIVANLWVSHWSSWTRKGREVTNNIMAIPLNKFTDVEQANKEELFLTNDFVEGNYKYKSQQELYEDRYKDFL